MPLTTTFYRGSGNPNNEISIPLPLTRWDGSGTPEKKNSERLRLEIERRDCGIRRRAVDRRASYSAARMLQRDRRRNLLASSKQHLTKEAWENEGSKPRFSDCGPVEARFARLGTRTVRTRTLSPQGLARQVENFFVNASSRSARRVDDRPRDSRCVVLPRLVGGCGGRAEIFCQAVLLA
jgi:hypothetical protein